MAPNKAFQSLRDFFKESEIVPFAENLDHDDFSPKSLALMSVHELQENFMLDEEIAKKIYQDLEPFRQKLKKQPNKKTKKRLSNLFNLLTPSAPSSKPTPKPAPKPTFVNEFEDLSEIIYADGDEWPMDPCSAAANADSLNYFQETYESERYEKYFNEYGWTPLMYACALNCKEIVSFILTKHPNLCIQNGEKQTALMIASSFGHVSIIKKLVEYSEENAETSDAKNIIAKNIGLHLADEGGFTALHYAVFYGHHPTIEYLLQLGSDPNVPDIEGMTPTLMACVDQFQEESLPALIKAGGSLYHCNHDGQNGFDIAKRKSLLSFQTLKPEGTLYGSF